ncbi:MAG TPA: TIR domain-containing protein [Ktedonobacteraceae bacterium]|nr:TIR domain-containing protein [Ktedonobacteraceae bacterium]
MSVKIFFCYAHKDEAFLDKLKEHLTAYKRKGLIDIWYDRNIDAGTNWQYEIDRNLNEAHIILLLVSPNFIVSDYCNSIELKQALELHKKGKARVIPIILRRIDWSQEPFSNLLALPKDGKPITAWSNRNDAFSDVGVGIYKVVKQLTQAQAPDLPGTLDIEIRQLGQQLAPNRDFDLPAAPARMQSIQQSNKVRSFKSPFTVEKMSLLNHFTNYRKSIENVAICPNGQILVSGSIDHTIEIWNLQTGKLEHTLTSNVSPVESISISADGQTLVSGCKDGTINIWNPYSDKVVRTFTDRHSGPVLSLAISQDEQILVSGSADRTIKIWHLQTGRLLKTCRDHLDSVWSVAINPDGKTLVSGSADTTIKIWNLSTGKLLYTLTGHSGPVWSIAINPKGNALISGSADTTINKWNLSTYSGQLSYTFIGHSRSVMSVAISPNGRDLVSGSADNTIMVWNLSACGKSVQTLNGHWDAVTSVAISPDGKTLASGSRDMTIKLWGT